MTTKEFYSAVLALDNLPTEIHDKATELLAAHDLKLKRNAETKKAKINSTNAPIIANILDMLKGRDWTLTSEISVKCGISTPKASALLLALKDDGVVESKAAKVKGQGERKVWKLVEMNEESEEETEEEIEEETED